MGEVAPVFTVEDALGSMKFGKFQYLCLAYAGMGWISEAMEMMLLSFVGPAVKNLWDLSGEKESLISSVVFAGMLIGSYTGGIISDKYGRRKGFFVTAIVTFLAGVASAFAPNYASLLVFRCLVGVGLGGSPVLFSWFMEFVPTAKRGLWMVIFSAFWTIGTILEAGLAWIVMPKIGWRWLVGLSSVPSSLLLVFYIWTPESPRYLCLKGRKAEALAVLESLARINGSKLPEGELVSEHELHLHGKMLPSEESNASKESVKAESSVFTLFSPQLLKITLLMWVVFFANAFMYYGLVLLTTELNSHDGHCSKDKKESSPPPAKSDSPDIDYKDVFITSFAEFPGLVISAVLIDYIGRKFSMTSMFFLCSIFLVPLIFDVPGSATTGLLFCARICITATFTIVYIYAPEAYPTSVRSTGFGLSSAMARVGGIVTPLVAVGMISGCHKVLALSVFVGVSFLAGICVLFFPFDTKGRELKDSVTTTRTDLAEGITLSKQNGTKDASSSKQNIQANASSSRQDVTIV